ncbi:MAG: type II toxin-antitoxin system RelE/ParE family toxin [Candidatus Binatota bacterium]
MARKVVWTYAAWTDLEGIADFISRDSPYYAGTLVREVREATRSLSQLAMRGRMVPEIGDKAIREIFVQNYRLIYRADKSRVAILAFIHGARDLRALWTKRYTN